MLHPIRFRGCVVLRLESRLGDGQETAVSTSDLAPFPRSPAIAKELATDSPRIPRL